ncbi:hypothetical protein EV363DRAFT_64293 [Boletus edulis]|nr:hypothetical protein EV363DRAFT_64293 [Boletus edulis]
MTITEFAIIVFKSPPDFSDPTLQSLFQKLFTWQSECSGLPLRFFTNRNEPTEVYLATGWTQTRDQISTRTIGSHESNATRTRCPNPKN